MRIGELRKSYQSRLVLDMCPIELGEGKIYAVVGANGSGKSTLLRLIAGTAVPDEGCPAPDTGDIRVGYMPQNSYPFKMSLYKNLLVGLDPSAENAAKARGLIDAFGMGELSGTRADRLSGGERQKMALMRLLMRQYGLLLLDEPTSAMDPQGALKAEELIEGYRRDTGCTVMMVTHSMKQAERIADMVIFLSGGRTSGPADTAAFLAGEAGEASREFLEFWGA